MTTYCQEGFRKFDYVDRQNWCYMPPAFLIIVEMPEATHITSLTRLGVRDSSAVRHATWVENNGRGAL